NEQINIAGAGINIAQRVMDCGDAGHILVSKRIAEDLEQYARWRQLLHDLGTCEVKHGVTLALVNLYSDEIGNPEVPKKFKGDEAREKRVEASAAVLRKSIAVLPFENLSEDKANAYFADGIQEEILARLTGAERRSISVQPTKNTEAHQLYLKGRYHWRNFFAPGYERIRDYFQRAIELDPSYAPAYVGLGGYHAFGAANGILSPDENWPKAESALKKALTLDETLAEAYNLVAGFELYYKRDWPAAERAF